MLTRIWCDRSQESSCGAICGSGTLGQLIPPTLILILLSDILQLSVGTLFAAAVVPGMLLAAIYCTYIIIIGMVKPELVPPLRREERDAVSRRQLWTRFFKVVVPPVLPPMVVQHATTVVKLATSPVTVLLPVLLVLGVVVVADLVVAVVAWMGAST